MRVRIIAGRYGNRWLEAPDTRRTHPMGERIRNALFNSIQNELPGANVLDAFAGTGSIGLEALSRDAATATFVESDRTAYRVLCHNIDSLHAQDIAHPIKARVASWIDTYQGEPFDLIFADPPYHDLQLPTISRLFTLLKPGGTMVLSHTEKGGEPNLINDDIVVVDNRGYGNAHLTFFYRKIDV